MDAVHCLLTRGRLKACLIDESRSTVLCQYLPLDCRFQLLVGREAAKVARLMSKVPVQSLQDLIDEAR